jgi:hypothetical protein
MSGVDFGGYATWPQYVSPNGQIYYIVPGQEDWMYDPVASQNTGRPQLFRNPEAAQKEKDEAEQKIEDANSPAKQIIPVAAGVAGTAGGVYVATKAPQWWGAAEAAKPVATAATTAATPAASAAVTPAATTGAGAFVEGATGAAAPFEVGTAANGGVLMSDGSVVGGGMFSPGGMLSPSGIGSAGNVILPAVGTYAAYDLMNRDLDKNGSGWARGIGQGAASGAMIGSYWGPTGAMIGAPIGAVVGAGKVAFGHKSTKEYQDQRKGELLDRGITGYADFINQLPQSTEDDPGYGKVPDMDNLTAEQVWGTNGVFDTFGNDWLGTYSEDQRRRISQALIDKGLFRGDHGDLIIHSDDKEEALKTRDEVLAQGDSPASPAPTAAPSRGEGPAKLPEGTVKNEQPVESGGQIVQPNQSRVAKLPASQGAFLQGANLTPVTMGALGESVAAQAKQPAWQALGEAAAGWDPNVIMPMPQLPAGVVNWPGGDIGAMGWNPSADAGFNPGQASQAAAAFTQAAAPTDWDAKMASGEYRKGSKAAGGYVNNKTNEWVAG